MSLTVADYTPPREYRMRCQDGQVRTVVEVDGFRVAEAARMAKAGERKKAEWVNYAQTRKADGQVIDPG